MINRDIQETANLARGVIEGIESHLDFDQKHIYLYLNDFYAYEMEHTTNLMVPKSDDILISTKSTF